MVQSYFVFHIRDCRRLYFIERLYFVEPQLYLSFPKLIIIVRDYPTAVTRYFTAEIFCLDVAIAYLQNCIELHNHAL